MLVDDSKENSYKIKLVGTLTDQIVVFNVQPQLSVHYEAEYETIKPTHMNSTYYSYVNSPAASYNFSDLKMVSRNQKEARMNLKKLLILRSWTKSYFGDVKNVAGEPDDLNSWLGAPPEVLFLSAYSNDKYGIMSNIPVVLNKLDITYPNEVDYIVTENQGDDRLSNVPFPIVVTLGIGLYEQHSPAEIEQFNLHMYRKGMLLGF